MFYLDWKDACMIAVAAFAGAFCFHLGVDVYFALSDLVGICRG